MNKNDEAPTADTVEANDAEGRDFPESTSCTIILPQITPQSKNILRHIRTGHANAITRRNLIQATGLPDRTLRLEIEALRRSGTVICTSGRGYFIPQTLEELQGFIKQEERRARSTFFTLQSARKLAEQMQQQGEQVRFSEVV